MDISLRTNPSGARLQHAGLPSYQHNKPINEDWLTMAWQHSQSEKIKNAMAEVMQLYHNGDIDDTVFKNIITALMGRYVEGEVSMMVDNVFARQLADF